MIHKKSTGILSGTGVFTAFGASLCCFSPFLAILGGSSFAVSWMESFRPYLIGASVLALGCAWFPILKSKSTGHCNCIAGEKKGFFQSKKFLVSMTLIAVLMITIPYSSAFETENKTAGIKDPMNKYSGKDFILQEKKHDKKGSTSPGNQRKKDCCRRD